MKRSMVALGCTLAALLLIAAIASSASASSSFFVPLGPDAGTLHVVITPSGQIHEGILHPPSPCSEGSGNPNCVIVAPGGGT